MTHDEQDARVRFCAGDLPVDAATVRSAALALVREHRGWPVLEISMDEAITVLACEPTRDGWIVRFEYVLDRDFASQYDKTETTAAWVALDATGNALDGGRE